MVTDYVPHQVFLGGGWSLASASQRAHLDRLVRGWSSDAGCLLEAAQVVGAVTGIMIAYLMFELPVLQASQHVRTGNAQWLAEAVATIGLLGVVWGTRSHGLQTTAASVALFITGAYWFTASTSFANPAVTLARSLTDTFAGIAPSNVLGFVIAQFTAMILVLPVLRRMG